MKYMFLQKFGWILLQKFLFDTNQSVDKLLDGNS